MRSEGLLVLGITAAQVTAMFSPVPGLCVAAELMSLIFQLCEDVSTNKHLTKQLRDRSYVLLAHIKNLIVDKQLSESLIDCTTELEGCLEMIRVKMTNWASLGKLAAFTQQPEIKRDIKACHHSLDLCITKLNLTNAIEMHDWMRKFRQNELRDKEFLETTLAAIDSRTLISAEASKESVELMRELMRTFQNTMKDRPKDFVHAKLSHNLYQIQCETNQLLPEHHLIHGEVKRIGDRPISGSPAMDIWEGLYLDRDKVTIKVLRSLSNDAKTLRRLKREGQIWKKVWELDQGRYILPFYGFSQSDSEGPYPGLVSPWQRNGNAISYVIKNPKVDYIGIIRGIAKGLALLHSLSIVHGDLKPSNIMIGQYGNPLIADFGLSRVVTDVNGAAFTQSHGVSESLKYFAPEVCIGDGSVSFKSDIYSYGMTVLELLTHKQPFHPVKFSSEVIIRTARGENPPRPQDPEISSRGLDDDLWNLLLRCWRMTPNSRPSVEDVLAELPSEEDENFF